MAFAVIITSDDTYVAVVNIANIEIVKIILGELGKGEDLIAYVSDRHGHDQRYAIDPYKVNVELGWDLVTHFEVGIRKAIAWYRSELGKRWLEECVGSERARLKENYRGQEVKAFFTMNK